MNNLCVRLISSMKRQIELVVNDYFNELHLQASESKEDFWRELHLLHGELAGKFKAAFTDQVGNRCYYVIRR